MNKKLLLFTVIALMFSISCVFAADDTAKKGKAAPVKAETRSMKLVEENEKGATYALVDSSGKVLGYQKLTYSNVPYATPTAEYTDGNGKPITGAEFHGIVMTGKSAVPETQSAGGAQSPAAAKSASGAGKNARTEDSSKDLGGGVTRFETKHYLDNVLVKTEFTDKLNIDGTVLLEGVREVLFDNGDLSKPVGVKGKSHNYTTGEDFEDYHPQVPAVSGETAGKAGPAVSAKSPIIGHRPRRTDEKVEEKAKGREAGGVVVPEGRREGFDVRDTGTFESFDRPGFEGGRQTFEQPQTQPQSPDRESHHH